MGGRKSERVVCKRLGGDTDGSMDGRVGDWVSEELDSWVRRIEA